MLLKSFEYIKQLTTNIVDETSLKPTTTTSQPDRVIENRIRGVI